MLDPKLLEILVCPQCRGELELTAQEDGLLCRACALEYEIRDGIPIMLPEQARKLTEKK